MSGAGKHPTQYHMFYQDNRDNDDDGRNFTQGGKHPRMFYQEDSGNKNKTQDDDSDSSEYTEYSNDESSDEFERYERYETCGGKRPACAVTDPGAIVMRVVSPCRHEQTLTKEELRNQSYHDYNLMMEKVSELDNTVKRLERELKEAKTSVSNNKNNNDQELVQHWQSVNGLLKRPSDNQIRILIMALVDKCASHENRNDIASIMRMDVKLKPEFVSGKVAFYLEDAEISNRILWQLWAFGVEERHLHECMEVPRGGDKQSVLPYQHAIVYTDAQSPFYFIMRVAGAPPLTPPRQPTTFSTSSDSLPLHDHSTSLTPHINEVSLQPHAPQTEEPKKIVNVLSNANIMFEKEFGKMPSEELQRAGKKYLQIKDESNTMAIDLADKEEDEQVWMNRAAPPRPSEGEHPDWPTECMTAAPPVHDNNGSEKCGVCGEAGYLTRCFGCGEEFHFTCCDAMRPVPGGDPKPWFCEQEKCQASKYRKLVGWRPLSIPPERFDCEICCNDRPLNMRVKKLGCECTNEEKHYCLSCVHKQIGDERRLESGNIECWFCKHICTGIERPGGNESLADIPFVTYDVPDRDDMNLTWVQRIRRDSVGWRQQEEDRMRREAEEKQAERDVYYRLAIGEINCKETVSLINAIQGNEIVGLDSDSEEEAVVLAKARAKFRDRNSARESRDKAKAHAFPIAEAAAHSTALRGQNRQVDSPGAPIEMQIARNIGESSSANRPSSSSSCNERSPSKSAKSKGKKVTLPQKTGKSSLSENDLPPREKFVLTDSDDE